MINSPDKINNIKKVDTKSNLACETLIQGLLAFFYFDNSCQYVLIYICYVLKEHDQETAGR